MFGWKSRLRLHRENAAMRQALLWYATEENWRRKGIHPRGAPRLQWRKSPAAFDRGHIALRTLRHIEDPVRLFFNIGVPPPRHMAPELDIDRTLMPGTAVSFPAPASTDKD